jgi:hypothetical protein
METAIKSWINKKVRIKDEYIKKEKVIDGNASTFDYDSDCYTDVVYMETEYIDAPNAMNCFFSGMERDIFDVRSSCYGVDLYGKGCLDIEIEKLPKPKHLIVVGNKNYECPYLWDAKYFEVVTEKVTTEWVVDEEYN